MTNFLGQRVLLLVFVIVSLLFISVSLSYIEENLSLILAVLLVVVLIYQTYDGFLDSIRSQIIIVTSRFKLLYFYFYLNLYINQLMALLISLPLGISVFYTKQLQSFFGDSFSGTMRLGKTASEFNHVLSVQTLAGFLSVVPIVERLFIDLRLGFTVRSYLVYMFLLG